MMSPVTRHRSFSCIQVSDSESHECAVFVCLFFFSRFFEHSVYREEQ